ncbi:MAG: tetratricopeptide repeat protein, partial [Gammaproteobacteria bacterium]|nr:tetratricopeptide repeat protein [Gammaproteobacteria bacterium]
EQLDYLTQLKDSIQPTVRVGIAMGEVVIADNTITGTGVVLAQRLEQLASPGRVVLQGACQETIPGRFPFEYQSLGEQKVKGFDESVRAYVVALKVGTAMPSPVPQVAVAGRPTRRWLTISVIAFLTILFGGLAWLQPWVQREEFARIERMAFSLPDKPSIAVLPFVNMSDDPKQEYFVDGMTADLITDLSKLSGLFVIARNSVFTYKGKPVKVQKVAEELGVRYVLEGSVRRAGEQVRINAQLIDATTGGHLWAERYDGTLTDVFALQDQVTREIIAALAVRLTGEEETARAQVETHDPQAYDAFLKGWQYYRRGAPDQFAQAIPYFELASRLDPEYARARAALAAVYWDSIRKGWWAKSLGVNYREAVGLARLYQGKAMEKPSALAHRVASEVVAYYGASLFGESREALTEAERAIALNGNDPAGYVAMATALLKTGNPAQALEQLRTAMRLDPHYPASYLNLLGQAQFALGEYQSAAATLERAAERNPDDDWTHAYLAATYGQLGQTKNARNAVFIANALRADRSMGALTLNHLRFGPTFFWLSDRAAVREGLARAGVPPHTDWLALVEWLQDDSRFEIDGATVIDATTARSLHQRGVPFIDLSSRYAQRHVPGAQHLEFFYQGFDFNEVRLSQQVDKAQEVVFYHHGEAEEAAHACAFAVTWGFEKVYCFTDGLRAWVAAGYPVETGN